MTEFLEKKGLSKAWRWGKLTLSVVLAVFALKYAGFLNSASDDEAVIGKNFSYNFDLKDMDGNITHARDLKGKVLFLNMWATWCGPCRGEMPSIQNLYAQVDTSKVAFVMLSLDTEDNHSKVVKYIHDKNFTFPVYLPHGELPLQLQVSTIPTTFIIGKDGKIRMKRVGMDDYDKPSFKTLLENLSAE